MCAKHLHEAIPASDELIDAIADIEMQRRETEKQAGFATSCRSALDRLQGLLAHETEALRLRGPGSGHRANIQAVTIEIARVKGLCAGPGQNSTPFPRNAHDEQRQESWQDAPRSGGRNKGRRTMGRAGGR